jgi:hypothetical protein
MRGQTPVSRSQTTGGEEESQLLSTSTSKLPTRSYRTAENNISSPTTDPTYHSTYISSASSDVDSYYNEMETARLNPTAQQLPLLQQQEQHHKRARCYNVWVAVCILINAFLLIVIASLLKASSSTAMIDNIPAALRLPNTTVTPTAPPTTADTEISGTQEDAKQYYNPTRLKPVSIQFIESEDDIVQAIVRDNYPLPMISTAAASDMNYILATGTFSRNVSGNGWHYLSVEGIDTCAFALVGGSSSTTPPFFLPGCRKGKNEPLEGSLKKLFAKSKSKSRGKDKDEG